MHREVSIKIVDPTDDSAALEMCLHKLMASAPVEWDIEVTWEEGYEPSEDEDTDVMGPQGEAGNRPPLE